MPTAAERQALAFLATIAVIGAGARVASARRFQRDMLQAVGATAPDSGSQAQRALDAQLAAVDSARSARPARRSRSPTTAASRRRASSSRRERPTLPSDGAAEVATEPVDVNVATAAELERLPRIGPALAQRIVAWRDANGPFDSPESLRHVPGIGVTTSALLAPLVTFSSGYRPFQSETRRSRRYPTPPQF